MDEFGRLSSRLDAVKPLQLRYEQLRVRIADWYANADPEQSYSEDGTAYSVVIGPKASKRSIIDMTGVAHKLGQKTFLELCSVSLEKLDALILPKDQAQLVVVEKTGPRTIRSVAKFVEPAA